MLEGLRTWVECESPTWDAGAVNRMLDIAARDMAIMGATIERIAGRQGFGGAVRARFPLIGIDMKSLVKLHAAAFCAALLALPAAKRR